MSRREKGAWAALLLVSLALHLFRLSERPYHHDESVHGWFAMRLAFEGDYRYDPVYHGPVQYLVVATAFRLLGDSDFTARLPAALGGVALSALALLMRRRWGREAAFAAGTLFAVSPLFLYYTRFCREDVWSLLGTAGGFLLLDRWFLTRAVKDAVCSSLLFAVAFGAKENFYVLLALMIPSAALVLIEPGRGPDLKRRSRDLASFLGENATAIAGAVLLFFAAGELLYTLFLVHPDAGNPAFEAVRYWWGQHKVERIGGPRWYYLPRLLQYEFAILVPAAVWALTHWRHLDAVSRFCFGWGVSSIAMYAWLGEKTPWLMLHQLLPFVPLAAAAWASLARNGSPALRAAGGSVAALSLASAWSLCFFRPALSPRFPEAESAVYVQTAPEIVDVVREAETAARAGADPAVAVDGAAGWPLSWYLRHLPVSWEAPLPGRPTPPIVVVDPAKADETARVLGSLFSREEIPLRAWWLPEVSASPLSPTPLQTARYLATRVPWSPIGWQSVVVFRRMRENPGSPR